MSQYQVVINDIIKQLEKLGYIQGAEKSNRINIYLNKMYKNIFINKNTDLAIKYLEEIKLLLVYLNDHCLAIKDNDFNINIIFKTNLLDNQVTHNKNISLIQTLGSINNIYNEIASLYPNYRSNKEFIIGYHQYHHTNENSFSDNMTINEILSFIEKNKKELTLIKIGEIVADIDRKIQEIYFDNPRHNQRTVITEEQQDNKIGFFSLYPQKLKPYFTMSNINTVAAISALFLATKHLEHIGDNDKTRKWVDSIAIAQLINHDQNENNQSEKITNQHRSMITNINEFVEKYHLISKRMSTQYEKK